MNFIFQGMQIFAGVENTCVICKEMKFDFLKGSMNIADIDKE